MTGQDNVRQYRRRFWGAPIALDWALLCQGLVDQGVLDVLPTPEQLRQLSVVQDVAALNDTRPGDICFVDSQRSFDQHMGPLPSVLITPAHLALKSSAMAVLRSQFPKVAFARITAAMYPAAVSHTVYADLIDDRHHHQQHPTSIKVAATARVSPSASLGDDVQIGPGALVADGACIGSGTCIGPNAVLGPNVVLGENSVVGPGAVLRNLVAGDACKFLAGAVVGERGYGLALGPPSIGAATPVSVEELPHIGAVVMGERCEVRHGAIVDRGALTNTVLGDDVHLDSHCTVGHNCVVGNRVSLGAYAGLAGSVTLGDNCILWVRAGVLEGKTIGDNVELKFSAVATKDFAAGNQVLMGNPAMPASTFARREGFLNRLFRKHSRP